MADFSSSKSNNTNDIRTNSSCTVYTSFWNYKLESGPASVQMMRYSSAGKCIESHFWGGQIGDMQV
jgi:hypothetical protein